MRSTICSRFTRPPHVERHVKGRYGRWGRISSNPRDLDSTWIRPGFGNQPGGDPCWHPQRQSTQRTR